MKIKKIFLVSLILLTLITLSAVSAAENITAETLTAEDNDNMISNNDILESSSDEDVLSAKKDSGIDVTFVTQDNDNEIYQIDEENDILADNYNHDYFRVKFTDKVNGTLHLSIDDKDMCEKTILSKTHYLFVNDKNYNLTAGAHSWQIKYSGDDNYKSALLNGTFNLNIKNDSGIKVSFVKENPNGTIGIINPDTDMFINDHESDYIMIKFPQKTQGTLSLYIDKKFVEEKTITSKTNYFFTNTKKYKLSEGKHEWKIRYSGDNTYKGCVLNGTYTLNPKNDSFVKKDSKMNVFIMGIDDDDSNDVTEYFKIKFSKNVSGTLSLYIDGKLKSEKKITAKTHYIYTNTPQYDLKKGNHNWEMKYSGDDEYNATSVSGTMRITVDSQKIKMQKTAPVVSASKKTFKTKTYTKKYTITLKANKKAMKNVYVYLTLKGKNYKKTLKVKTNSKGQATFAIQGATKKGKYTGTIKYYGNKNYKSFTKALTITNTKSKSTFKPGKTSVTKKIDYQIITVKHQSYNGQIDVSEAYELLNQFRQEKGVWQWEKNNVDKKVFNTNADNTLNPLIRDNAFEKTAQIRAEDLVEKFDHTRPDGNSCWTVYPTQKDGYYATGENIAIGQRTCKDVIEAWKEANDLYDGQGHRRNMLSPASEVVGIAGYKINDIIYWVQSFGVDLNN